MLTTLGKGLDAELDPSSSTSVLPVLSREEVSRDSNSQGGEKRVTARVSSLGPSDTTEEDLNKDDMTRATGYHGKSSDIVWLHRLQQDTGPPASELDGISSIDGESRPSRMFSLAPLSNSTYLCDDLPISLPGIEINPYEQPPREVADALFHSYLVTVHATFPIIGRSTFVQQYINFRRTAASSNNSWLAILNLIFAIGAKNACMTEVDWIESGGDHMIYFTRARILGLNFNSILDHPDLQRIQIYGLISFYLAACSQINR